MQCELCVATLNPDMLGNAVRVICEQYPNDFTDELDSEVRSFEPNSERRLQSRKLF